MKRIVKIVERDVYDAWLKEQQPYYMTSIRNTDADPFNQCLFLCGDFNLMREGDQTMHLELPDRIRVLSLDRHFSARVPSLKPLERQWKALFARMVEITIADHSHVNIAKLTTNGINRIFTSLPPSALLSLANNSGVVADPLSFYCKGFSDHAPVFASFRVRRLDSNLPPRIRRCWCKHPLFKKLTRDYSGSAIGCCLYSAGRRYLMS